MNFDPSTDAAARGLNAFRAPAPGQPLTFSDISGTVRSYANALPIVGGLNNKIEAGLEATIAPVLNSFFDPQDQLSESSLRERCNHALEKQNDIDAKFAAKHPDLDRAAKVAARLTLLGAALRMSSAFGCRGAQLAPDAEPRACRGRIDAAAIRRAGGQRAHDMPDGCGQHCRQSAEIDDRESGPHIPNPVKHGDGATEDRDFAVRVLPRDVVAAAPCGKITLARVQPVRTAETIVCER